ncbi:hypothetical protein [Aliidiomarina soli]|uniref:DUF3828 domain-containing protein n=1 Tax=Aliidiomarina soli TaxID=1928574 RepID=A0A432WM58_9GAMM|nr:hypothetical protein [Aliidiomarina soli]RUO34777.1 hypothetical protein CWE14_01920 [Aliidiomarina soli]
MKLRNTWAAALTVMGALLLTGCWEQKIQEPEAHERAIDYFELLYNERDIEAAAKLATEEHRQLIMRYGSVASVGRYLYNMDFDHVEVNADRQGVTLFNEQANTARVQVSLGGVSGSRRVETIRDVLMVREGGKWYLARILDGPMN